MITKSEIEKLETLHAKFREASNGKPVTDESLEAWALLTVALANNAPSLLTLAKSALGELEHHEAQLNFFDPILKDFKSISPNTEIADGVENRLNYHRARIEAIKGKSI